MTNPDGISIDFDPITGELTIQPTLGGVDLDRQHFYNPRAKTIWFDLPAHALVWFADGSSLALTSTPERAPVALFRATRVIQLSARDALAPLNVLIKYLPRISEIESGWMLFDAQHSPVTEPPEADIQTVIETPSGAVTVTTGCYPCAEFSSGGTSVVLEPRTCTLDTRDNTVHLYSAIGITLKFSSEIEAAAALARIRRALSHFHCRVDIEPHPHCCVCGLEDCPDEDHHFYDALERAAERHERKTANASKTSETECSEVAPLRRHDQ